MQHTINDISGMETMLKALKKYMVHLEKNIEACENSPKTYGRTMLASYEGEYRRTAALCIWVSKQIKRLQP